jgi:prepilin-type N-terminal cleavage/methylation domain-containing protein
LCPACQVKQGPAKQGPAKQGPGRERGFTLLEVLAALAVTGFVLSAIGTVFAVTLTGTRSAGERVALAETGRRLLADLPARDRLRGGTSSGRAGDLSWRLDIGARGRGVVDSQKPPPWLPIKAALTVQVPSGRWIRLETVRLVRGEAK